MIQARDDISVMTVAANRDIFTETENPGDQAYEV